MDNDQESVAESLLKSVASTNSTDAIISFSESILDSATETIIQNDLLREVPVVSTLVGLTKGVIAYRDRRYINKILSYLSETSKASEEDRKRFRAKLDTKPEESLKAGEVIMDIIDKVTSAEKAALLGKIFRAYMHEEELTLQQLIYLSEIIERTYLQDLIALQKSELFNEANLESVGIKKPIRTEDVNKLISDALHDYKAQQDQAFRTQSQGITPMELKIPTIPESGMTDVGYQLVRILRDY